MRRKHVLVGFGALLGVALLAAGGAFAWWSSSGRPQRAGEARVAGLGARVDVRFDDAGVPHVSAASLDDLAGALGWLHANDRIGQMELQRRYAFGRLSELLGERTVALDRSMRELRFGETAERMLAALSPRSRALLEAYARGVNAWLDARAGDLPPDLVLLRAAPEPWTARDSVGVELLLAQMLSYSRWRELQRFEWLGAFGPQRATELIGVPGLAIAPGVAELAHELDVRQTLRRLESHEKGSNGSNNWAVDATRTLEGHALLANDPHLGLRLPAHWFQALLRAPEYEASGFTLPGLPMVVIGQGAHLAWGFTNTELDVCDLFLERVSDDGKSVERDGAWVPLEFQREVLHVRGADDVAFEIARSDIGPFFAESSNRPACSLAWSAYEPFDPFEPFLALARAKSIDEVPAAAASFICPVQNLVCADSGGAVLFTLLGRNVERGFGDGKLPAPAWSGEYRWRGLAPHEHTPQIERPAAGFVVTANNDTRPAGFAFPYSGDFAAPSRAQRIAQRLAERRDWTPGELASIQTDVNSPYALELVRALPAFGADDLGAAQRAGGTLRAWSGDMSQRGAAALYAAFERELERECFGAKFEGAGVGGLSHPEEKPALLRALRGVDATEPMAAGVAAPETHRRSIETALAKAWDECAARWGADVAQWDYGALHRWTPHHALGDAPVLGRFFDRAPLELPGSDTTPCVFSGSWHDGAIEVGHGASLRLVADAADPDRSLAVLPGGQSGQPFDEHYDDQLAAYVAGRLRPMYWSEAAIEAHTRSRLVLAP